MKYIVTVADDFGFSEGVNRGCIDACNNGVLKELSLMVYSFGTEQAIKLATQNNINGLGIHLTINPELSSGVYFRTADYTNLLATKNQKYLSNLVKDEIKKFEDLVGKVPTHINGHQNCFAHDKIIDTIIEYALENDIFVRRFINLGSKNSGAGNDINSKVEKSKVKITDNILEQIEGSYESAYNGFTSYLDTVEDGTITELFFHPAYVDETMRQYTSLLEERERDVKLLTDERFITDVENKGFRFVNFGDLS